MRSRVSGRLAALVAATVFVAAGAALGAPATVSGVFEYEVEMSASSQPPQKMTQKVWAKGARYRSETMTPMGKQILISGPDGALMMNPGSAEALKVPVPRGAKSSMAGSPFGDITKIRQMKKVGTEKVGAYTAEIHEQTMTMNRPGGTSGEFSNRFWITDALPVPVKVMNKSPVMQVTMLLKSADTKASVPDSMFLLPKGTKIREMKMPPPGQPGAKPTAPKGK